MDNFAYKNAYPFFIFSPCDHLTAPYRAPNQPVTAISDSF